MSTTRLDPKLDRQSSSPTQASAITRLLRIWRALTPTLAGATPRDRLFACIGAFVGIAIVGLQGALVHGDGADAVFIVAPLGASAVLLFAVPASPMAQPWAVIGGNGLSALVGLLVAHVVHNPPVAAGLAVGLAIGVMSLTRCLHPPSGAVALTVVLGGGAVDSAGNLFPLYPVAMNAVALVLIAWAFHRLSGHAYPHLPHLAPPALPREEEAPREPVRIGREELDEVLNKVGEAFDIERDDLLLLLRELEQRGLARGPQAG